MAYNYSPQAYPYALQTYNYSPQTYAPQQTQNTAPINSIIWVQGEAGAKSYLVAPNSTVTLWDTESQTIYIKSADASGMPSMRVLEYTIRPEALDTGKFSPESDFVRKSDLDTIREEINALKAKFEDIGEVTK